MPQADDKRQQATAELAAREHEYESALKKVERLARSEPEGHSMLMLGCILVAIASIGLCVGAVVAVIKDQQHVTTGGTIAAISGGALFATLVTALIVSFYRKRVAAVQDETPLASSSNGSRSTRSASKPSPPKVAASKP